MDTVTFEAYFGLYKSVCDTLLITPECMTPAPVLDDDFEELAAWEKVFLAVINGGIEGERGRKQCERFRDKFQRWCEKKQKAWTESILAEQRAKSEERFRKQRGGRR